MKKLIGIIAAAAFAAPLLAAEPGQPAPDFAVKDCCGENVKLADFEGKVVVLEWYNRDCPFVKKHYGSKNMQKLQEKYTAQGVVWLQVVSSAAGKQGSFANMEEAMKDMETQGSKATKLLLDPDGKMGQAYGAKVTPHMFIVGKDGKIAYAGAIDDDNAIKFNPAAKNYVAAALDEILAGKPVATASTQPYGCGVKY